MSTLAIMKARVALELARTDLTTQIASAITDAIAVYQKERFRFSDSIPLTVPAFNTVAGQWIYTAVDNPIISSMMKVDYIAALIGGMLQPLTQESPETMRLWHLTMSGPPQWWAYEGNSLLLSPVPNDVYRIVLDAFLSVPAPASDSEANNPWMTSAELLIRSRAKYEIATHVTRNQTMQDAMSPAPPPPGKATGHATYWAWKSLKGEANRITGTGRVRAMQF